jgi:hypothetical protein
VRIINGERRQGFYSERAVAQLATALLDVITWTRPAGATQTASVRCEGPIHHHARAANGANGGDIAGTGTDYRVAMRAGLLRLFSELCLNLCAFATARIATRSVAGRVLA